jgi:hypothetical protein
VRRDHLRAALAVWRYCYDSARYVFGDRLGNPLADDILRALRAAGSAGLLRSALSRDVLARNKSKQELDRALALLVECRLADYKAEPSGRRPAERWFVTEGYDINDVSPTSAEDMSFMSSDLCEGENTGRI